MRLYVGNLSYELSERELRDAFAAHAAVKEVEIVRDKESGRSKGFGFVELMMESDADAAIAAAMRVRARGAGVKDAVGGAGPGG